VAPGVEDPPAEVVANRSVALHGAAAANRSAVLRGAVAASRSAVPPGAGRPGVAVLHASVEPPAVGPTPPLPGPGARPAPVRLRGRSCPRPHADAGTAGTDVGTTIPPTYVVTATTTNTVHTNDVTDFHPANRSWGWSAACWSLVSLVSSSSSPCSFEPSPSPPRGIFSAARTHRVRSTHPQQDRTILETSITCVPHPFFPRPPFCRRRPCGGTS